MDNDSTTIDDVPTGDNYAHPWNEWRVVKTKIQTSPAKGKAAKTLENHDEALQGYHGEDEPPNEDKPRELGIDPKQNTSKCRLHPRGQAPRHSPCSSVDLSYTSKRSSK